MIVIIIFLKRDFLEGLKLHSVGPNLMRHHTPPGISRPS